MWLKTILERSLLTDRFVKTKQKPRGSLTKSSWQGCREQAFLYMDHAHTTAQFLWGELAKLYRRWALPQQPHLQDKAQWQRDKSEEWQLAVLLPVTLFTITKDLNRPSVRQEESAGISWTLRCDVLTAGEQGRPAKGGAGRDLVVRNRISALVYSEKEWACENTFLRVDIRITYLHTCTHTYVLFIPGGNNVRVKRKSTHRVTAFFWPEVQLVGAWFRSRPGPRQARLEGNRCCFSLFLSPSLPLSKIKVKNKIKANTSISPDGD